MTQLDDKGDLKQVIACQTSYLFLEASVCNYLACTKSHDFVITEAINHLRGVVQTFFSTIENQQTIHQELALYYDQTPVFDANIPRNDLFQRELVLDCGLRLRVSPRSQFIQYEVM